MYLLNLICFALVLSPLAQAEIEPEDIVGIWLFDQGAGKVAQDSSDNGIDGELKGGVKWVNGKFGKALLFPGIDQNFVEVPHEDSLNLTSFSFTLWLKIEATGNYQATFIKTANGLLENYSGYIYAGRKVFWTRFTSGGNTKWGFQKFGTTIITDDKWHHVVASYNRGKQLIFVDGKLDAEKTVGHKLMGKEIVRYGYIGTGSEAATFGAPTGPTWVFKGIMDEFMLFHRCLTADEVAHLATGPAHPF